MIVFNIQGPLRALEALNDWGGPYIKQDDTPHPFAYFNLVTSLTQLQKYDHIH